MADLKLVLQSTSLTWGCGRTLEEVVHLRSFARATLENEPYRGLLIWEEDGQVLRLGSLVLNMDNFAATSMPSLRNWRSQLAIFFEFSGLPYLSLVASRMTGDALIKVTFFSVIRATTS